MKGSIRPLHLPQRLIDLFGHIAIAAGRFQQILRLSEECYSEPNKVSPILHPTELHINIVHRHTESRRASVAHVQGQEVQPDKLHRYGVANGIIQQEHLHRTIYG